LREATAVDLGELRQICRYRVPDTLVLVARQLPVAQHILVGDPAEVWPSGPVEQIGDGIGLARGDAATCEQQIHQGSELLQRGKRIRLFEAAHTGLGGLERLERTSPFFGLQSEHGLCETG
jgi:hypothetical protein